MCAQTVILAPAGFTSDVVQHDHFEVNAVFTKDFLDPGGAFDRMIQQMGWTGLRFPGGTVAEQSFFPGSEIVDRLFDMDRPSGLADDDAPRIVTAPAALAYTAENDLSFNFTLPTENYLDPTAAEDGNRLASQFGLYRLLDRVDEIIREEYGPTPQEIFEIGNEFWYQDDRLSASEYGNMANEMAIGMQALFDVYETERGGPEAWTQPLISVQSAPGWYEGGNDEIVGQMSLAARGAIDAVTAHYYPDSYAAADMRQPLFDNVHEWQSLEGVTQELDIFVSEWNIQNGGETGLPHASAMLEAMRVMLENGVDHAAVWGTQYFNLGNRLAALKVDEDAPGGLSYTLTPAGEVYRMMSDDIRGLRVLDLDTPEALRDAVDVPPEERAPEDAEQLVMHAWGGADTTIVFLSSRSDVPIEVTLDPSGLLPSYNHVWAERLGVIDDPTTPDVDEGDPLSKLARPYIETYNADELAGPGGLTLTLQPYEIVQFEFTTGDIGVDMAGHDQVVDPDADYDDELLGTNFGDRIAGNAGADTLRGHGGDDTLLGGEGDDFLGGWVGADHLDAGAGDDTIRAGDGDDTLIAGTGRNLLFGEEGTDQFIVDIEGQTEIRDFDLDSGEGLSFLDAYESAEDVLARVAVDGGDLVIDHDGDGETRLVGLGAREAELEGALSDFQEASPVADLVAALTTPPPDGSIPPDPEPAPQEDPAFSLEQLETLLNFEQPEDVSAFVSALSPEEESSLLDQLNANAFALSAKPALWGTFCDNLSDEGFERFIEDVDPGILDMRYLRGAAEQYANGADDLGDVSELPLCRTFPNVSEDVRTEYYLALSVEERGQLEQYWADQNPEEIGQTAAEILGVDPAVAEGRRLDLLQNDEEPDFVRYLPPGIYTNEHLEQQIADEEEEDDPGLGGGGGGGGGCFVATCAYGDKDHPDVVYLRQFRDRRLSRNAAGRLFIRIYYRVGPWLAAAIGPFPVMRRAVRRGLARMVHRMQRRGI